MPPPGISPAGGRAYRVSLLLFGQSGKAPNPVYEPVPADPLIKSRQTLAHSCGRYYTFRYRQPFYGSGSGLTSINGDQSVSFYDNPRYQPRGKHSSAAGR